MKRGARARGSQPCSREARVTVRAHYGALPFAAGRGQDEGRRNPAGSGQLRALLSRKHGPDAQRRAADAGRGSLRRGFARCVSRDSGPAHAQRWWSAARRCAFRLPAFASGGPESDDNHVAPGGAPFPSIGTRGEQKLHPAHSRRGNADVCLKFARCLTTESRGGMTRGVCAQVWRQQ